VVTAMESRRLAKGSSGRSETEMSCLSSSSLSPSAVGSSLAHRPCASCQSLFAVFLIHRTLLSFRGPPSEAMPLSTFLMMHGCSTTETGRNGMGSHGACCCSWLVVELLVMVLSACRACHDGSKPFHDADVCCHTRQRFRRPILSRSWSAVRIAASLCDRDLAILAVGWLRCIRSQRRGRQP
jgi:hypothetical protein